MLLEIVKYPDARLNKRAEKVGEITPQIRKLAEDMIETMYNAEGVGLAAPQVGQSLRLIVMDHNYREGSGQPRVFVDPEIELAGELITSENEGCLSVPLNFRADVPRYAIVRIKARDIDGNPIDEVLEGLPAIIVQHETDHLDGKLFIDRISHLKRSMYDNKVKKWHKASA